MDSVQFQKLLAKRFYPVLRKEGFKGSGSTLRRINEPLVHVFNIQGSSSGKGFYVNLGAHLQFLGSKQSAKTRECDCVFRDRIDPRANNPGKRWVYGDSEIESCAVIDELANEWNNSGRSFFDQFATYPDSFELLIQTTDTSEMNPFHIFTYAKIARQLGHAGVAEGMVCEAIPRVDERAKSLLGNLKSFLRELRDDQR